MPLVPVFMFSGFAIFVCVGWYLSTYNRFVKYRNRIEEAWSSIDVALKRRFNLIPNLQKMVTAYGSHEAEIFSETDTVGALTDAPKRAADESRISKGLDGLLALAEDYPDLKASQNFLSLQARLAEVETDIQKAREKFNRAVRRYNTLVESVPSNIIARKFNFTKVEYFTLELATQRALPDITIGQK